MQQIVAASARSHEVDSWEDALVAERSVELQLHVTRAFEFLENHFVHLAARVDEGCCDDGERAATLDVARCTKEAFGLLQCVGIHTTCEHLAAGGAHRVVGTRQAGDGVEEYHHVVATFHHTFGLFEHDTSNFHVAFGRLIESRCNNFGIHRASHVGHLLRAFVDEQHHQVGLGVIGCDGVGNVFHQDGLTRLGLCHDEGTLTFSDGREQVDDACREIGGAAVATEREFLFGEEWGEVFERHAIAHFSRVAAIDFVDAGKWKIFLALVRWTHMAFNDIARLQPMFLNDVGCDINIVGR